MKRLIIGAVAFMVTALAGCHDDDAMLVYSSGFSFLEVRIRDRRKAGQSGYEPRAVRAGCRVIESPYSIQHEGNRRQGIQRPVDDDRSKTLLARMALSASKKKLVITVSFDDMVTGRTGASVTTYADGDLFDAGSRTSVFNDAAGELVKAVQHDQGLKISDSNDKKIIVEIVMAVCA